MKIDYVKSFTQPHELENELLIRIQHRAHFAILYMNTIDRCVFNNIMSEQLRIGSGCENGKYQVIPE